MRRVRHCAARAQRRGDHRGLGQFRVGRAGLAALLVWISMQYGHCVVTATATAISSLYFTGIAPSVTASRSNAQKAFISSGASSFIRLIFDRLSLLYMAFLLSRAAARGE